mmetsp:Transcript_8977/g.16402  ORF Transcript_8977/g.16402 Transcript_8977/m.16402 type:complete len:235 (-) Transcript_8977:734-1438(-)
MQHRSMSLSTMSSFEGSTTASTFRSIFRPTHWSCFGFVAEESSPFRAQNSIRSESLDFRSFSSCLYCCSVIPSRKLICVLTGTMAVSSSASSSLSSISTRTGPLTFSSTSSCTLGASLPGDCSSWAFRASSQAARVFSSRSRASRLVGKIVSASSRSFNASSHLCRARNAVARRVKALKQASALRLKPSSKISAYSITLLQELIASCHRKTLSSASALLVHSALQSRRYSRPSS